MTQKKTGMEMLEELCETCATFDRRLVIVEDLLKQLLDAGRKSASVAAADGLPPGLMVNDRPARMAGQTEAPPERRPSIESAAAQPPAINVSPNIKVMGKIRHDGKGLPEVAVTIHDARNHVVKKTKTNRAGHWMAFLPPGKYAAECVMEGKVNGNVVFTVAPGDTAVNVGQPE